jgi:hypothetical protein
MSPSLRCVGAGASETEADRFDAMLAIAMLNVANDLSMLEIKSVSTGGSAIQRLPQLPMLDFESRSGDGRVSPRNPVRPGKYMRRTFPLLTNRSSLKSCSTVGPVAQARWLPTSGINLGLDPWVAALLFRSQGAEPALTNDQATPPRQQLFRPAISGQGGGG